MSFDDRKNIVLKKKDKSSKGSVDRAIKKLVNKINKFPDYFTTSSCSGRTVLLHSKDFSKKSSKWLYVSHSKAKINDIKKAIKLVDMLWFKFEPVILHVSCRNLDSASKLVSLAKSVGLKQSGIMSVKNFSVEISDKQSMDVPIVKNGEILVDENYLKVLVNEANSKLKKTRERANKLLKKL